MLSEARTDKTVERLLAEGSIEAVSIEGIKRPYLAPAGFRECKVEKPDGVMRILGPLDPVLWDRALVRDLFGFDYVWEVYKPKAERKYGWYVCPLYHRGLLVGRIEAKVEGTNNGSVLVVDRLWRESGAGFDEDAFDDALERHAKACGASSIKRGRGARRR